VLPGKAEWLPTMHLLNTSLAALFFQAAAGRAPDAGS
jgi:hypothetical protein